ncbi:hypothetical protein MUK42_11705 [Musa troglodytarum]|uniref:Uncharacterized protein n=1 Tax=Musa troglodytarum TaxID=320322 RepID=A0A9E7K4Q3_9LILI|nr:hypothetical protein MUK42_11705 [Musa troglodytarum]
MGSKQKHEHFQIPMHDLAVKSCIGHMQYIQDNWIAKVYITPDGALSQQRMERHTPRDGFLPTADGDNPYRTPNSGWSGIPHPPKWGHVPPNNGWRNCLTITSDGPLIPEENRHTCSRQGYIC